MMMINLVVPVFGPVLLSDYLHGNVFMQPSKILLKCPCLITFLARPI